MGDGEADLARSTAEGVGGLKSKPPGTLSYIVTLSVLSVQQPVVVTMQKFRDDV